MFPELPRGRILVVEDSRTQRTKLRRTLESAGFEVDEAEDGQAGFDSLARSISAVALILSDVQMPRLSGYDLCRRIKADPELKDTPVILMTTLGNPTDIIRGLECGADGYVNKPFEPADILARVRDLLRCHGLRARHAAGDDGVELLFMGERFTIESDKPRILDFLAATFEDFARASKREQATLLAQVKYRQEAEARRIREESLVREGESLREAREFLQSTLDALTSQIAILDEQGTIIAVNAAWGGTEGSSPLIGARCRVGTNYLEVCESAPGGKAELSAIARGVRAVLAGQRPEFCLESPCPAPEDGRWFSIRATPFRGAGPSRVVVAHEDISQRKAAEAHLQHAATHDALTGLPNRVLFADRLERVIQRSRRQGADHFALLFLDFDNFKMVNDSLGHRAGDQLLNGIARRLETIPRGSDSIARLGGDEFAILADDVDQVDGAIQLAQRINEILRTPFDIDGKAVFATASIGIAMGDSGHEHSNDMLRDADTAMYHAKAAGRGRHAVFARAMHTHTVNRMELESDLRAALESEDFRVHYQPIVCLATGRIDGLEALVRWTHLTRGPIGPATFIPIAEETGAILQLGLWVLRQACRQMQAWRDELPFVEPLAMSVNLSALQFAQRDLVEQVDRVLRETGLDPRRLKLEVTETAAMKNAEAAIDVLGRLKELGIRLSLDDFGTGYSSLSFLHRFPLDTLKIDRSFIHRIDDEGRNTEIVRTIGAMAKNLGMDVVAEGVETAVQRTVLHRLGCQYGQGYLFARPMDALAVKALFLAEASLYAAKPAPCALGSSPDPGSRRPTMVQV